MKETWGGYWCKIHGGKFQPRIIDIIGCYRGYFVAFEVKRPNKKATERQRLTIEEICRSGGVAAVVWDKRECNKILDELHRKAIDTAHGDPYDGIDLFRKLDQKGVTGTMAKNKSRKAKEEDEDLEDEEELEDLEDLDDEDEEDEESEDEESEDEEEDEEEEPVPAKTSKSKKAAKAEKPAKKAKADKPKGTGRGGNPVPPRRTPADGFGSVSDLVAVMKKLGHKDADARIVRRHLRKLAVTKTDGIYQWKPKDLEGVAKKVIKSMAEAEKAKTAA